MKQFIILLLLFSLVHASNVIPVEFKDTYTDKNLKKQTTIFKSHISKKDSTRFFSDTSSYKTKESLLQGYTELYRNGHKYGQGEYKDGQNIGRWEYYDSKGRVTQLVMRDERGKIKKQVSYSYDAKGRQSKNTVKASPFFRDYHWGLQHPTNFDVAYPTGFTLSSTNLHFEIPMPHIADRYRPVVVLAGEVGINGYALRTGISPYINKDYYVSEIWGFTPVTVNASFTYLWKDKDYNKLPDPTPYRWHVGADADLNFVFGHIRLGAFRLIGPESERPWKFMFSVGASPAILAIPFTAH